MSEGCQPRCSTGRADLLRALHGLSAGAQSTGVARLLGYQGTLVEPVRGPQTPAALFAASPEPASELALEPAPEPRPQPAPAPMHDLPQPAADARQARFLRPLAVWTQQAAREAARETKPLLSRAEIVAPRDRAEPAAPMLQPWKRLSPYLRQVLGRVVEGRRLDLPRAVTVLAWLRPVHRLPRQRLRCWADAAVVIVDCRSELAPFRPDADALWARLQTERGRLGLHQHFWRALPAGAADDLPRGAAVLVLGDLGRLANDEADARAWTEFGRELRRRGHPLAALLPCPPDRWSPEQARVWPSAVWDRCQALPRGGAGLRPRPGPGRAERRREAVARLLALLSSAVRIEPGMLRLLRGLLPDAEADVGAEYDAWNHPDLARSEFAAGFLPGTAPRHRARLAELPASLVAAAAAILLAWHELFSPAYQDDLVLRLADAGVKLAPERVWAARDRYRRLVDTLVAQARGDHRVERGMGLERLAENQLDRWSPADRANPEVSRAYAALAVLRGRALAERPEGLDPRVVEAVFNSLVPPEAQAEHWQLCQEGEGLVWRRAGAALSGPIGAPVAGIEALRPRFAARAWTASGESRVWELLPPEGPSWRLPLADVERVRVAGDLAKLELAHEPRPSWASRMGRDRYGLYGDLELAEGVALRLRWIPPGRFLMGSPEGEQGRFSDEGPRHEVTISSGFWLGATPVTQAQWTAVMGANPSKFKEEPGSLERPVECVDWHWARAFAVELAERYPELVWDLPGEAEWEYACRAGTESAFNDGSACTEPEGKDAALERLGWYGSYNSLGNSGGEAHSVARKRPNIWGLHDMHGNVWEWCLDGERRYETKTEVDPLGPMEASGFRVVRGGGWFSHPRGCRSAFREGFGPGKRNGGLGFRLAAGQELQVSDGARGLAAEAGRDAPTTGRSVRGVRRARPWAQRFARDEFGVRLEFTLHDTLFVWRWIPRGKFPMGSPKEESGRWNDEGPRHEVTISRGFWLGATPVTQAQWESVLGVAANESHFKGAERPVENATWQRCMDYAGELNRLLPGLGARLPSEAEWEYACRAGTTSAFNDGSACTVQEGKDPALEALGWYDENSGRQTQPVGQKRANAWGLHDMHGNVWEWCADWRANRYTGEARIDPTGPENGDHRVLRGGSWGGCARVCRSAFRRYVHPGIRVGDLGFRLAAGPELKSEGGARKEERSERLAGEGTAKGEGFLP